MQKILTKTNFLRCLQCHKYLWLAKSRKELFPKIDETQKAIFDQGYAVENYARQLFEDGVEIESHFEEARRETKELIGEGQTTLFQATAFENQLFAKSDILHFNSKTKKWDIYEVKSSTKVKEEHYPDLAFQKHAFQQDGLGIGQCFLVHVNNEYVKDGEIEPDQLLSIIDLTEQVEAILPFVKEEIPKAIKCLEEKTELNKEIGKQCNKPYECAFKKYCWKHVPEDSIFDISRLAEAKLNDLLQQKILRIKDISDDFPLTENQNLHVNAIKTGQITINSKVIEGVVSALGYPLYFLDYESYAPAIPLYDGVSPYQQVCFQYSLHVLEEDGVMKHCEYLATSEENPIPELLRRLEEDIGEVGSVVVWNKSFEMGRNREMGELFPKYKRFLDDINERIFDLMDIFKDGHFVHPDFKGGYSIKKILPVLAPEFSHKALTIQAGEMAALSWHKMVYSEISGEEKTKIKEALLEYCKLDTLAMVLIWDELKKRLQGKKLKKLKNITG